MKKRLILFGFLIVFQFQVFSETLYPAKILPATGIVYQNDFLIIGAEGIGWKWSLLNFSRYNIEANTVKPLACISGNDLHYFISDDEMLVAYDIIDGKNSIYVDYVFNEEKSLFERVTYNPQNYLLVREVPDSVSKEFKNPEVLWERIGNYYIKLEEWNGKEKRSFIIVDLEGNYINTIPIHCYDYDSVISVAYTIGTTQNDKYLYLHYRLSTDCRSIDKRLREDNLYTIIYELIPDDQVPFANTEIVEFEEIPSDTDMPAYKVTTRTVDASSLVVPLKPEAKILKAADNLRLRKTELTSSDIITTMQKGTLVKILATGRQEIIDGITGNWVQVEVQPGGKDRNGAAIPAGTTGWCFGGYLE